MNNRRLQKCRDIELTDIHGRVLFAHVIINVDGAEREDWRAAAADQYHSQHKDDDVRRSK